ncbi:expressed unknown protein [Seminavis robusta]|uniref:Uncharacterized protein n=1 Tax=Seminavis robusta TaxID=568900 RepID=A0A9N8HP42_9STRA|nr:expressed unknown protein [Seminavis robusta]|eukprot:Sro871_g213870.1 n/a (224) ;mRNA; f:36496-37259
MPPSAWMEEAEKANCAHIVDAMIYISNESGTRFDVFWINPKTQTLTQITLDPVEPRIVAPYNTHVDQVLELHEIPDATTGECSSPEQVCRRTYAKAHSEDKTKNVYKITKDFEAVHVTDNLRARAYAGETIASALTFQNSSGETVDIFWVDHTGNKVHLGPLNPGGTAAFDSFVGNEFAVQESGESCGDSCRITHVKNPGNDPTIVIQERFQAMYQGRDISEP